MTADQSSLAGADGFCEGSILLPAASGALGWLPHGRVQWQGGRVRAVHALPAGPVPPSVFVPGFVDLHCHWPQSHVRGQFGGTLLDWLRDAIWPAEEAFADSSVACARVDAFVAEVTAAGTCAGLFFGPPQVAASVAFANVAPHGFFAGPALMEVNAPPALLQPVAESLAQLQREPELRKCMAVSPRFAPNLTEAGLRRAGDVARATGWPVQSHVAETREEVAWVRELFPAARSYVDVYRRAGLLGPRTVLAHAVHVSDRELEQLAATGTVIAHCPTSNEALRSGRMPLERVRARGVRWVLATDVGAGPKLSLLDVIRVALVAHIGAAAITPGEALCRATAIPGAFLAALDPDLKGLGTFEIGAPAHVVEFTRPVGAHADDVVRGLAGSAGDLDRLPRRVVRWGLACSPS
ncbi:MAG: guanine deaminase [Myxococcales bacterium]|nr:guanine deaminase [Myxococcales bacterium]